MKNKNVLKQLLLVLFISYLNPLKAQNINHWEMVVAAEDNWQYFLGNAEPPVNWAAIDFDASTWDTGAGGIGYGDNDDATIIESVTSVYIRNTFTLIDTSVLSWALLYVDYDDAFVAYLNGHEIARANIGTIGTPPAYSSFALALHEAQMYSGGLPEQFIIHNDTLVKYIKQGNNVLALQVHNFDANSSDLSSTTFLLVGINDEANYYRELPSWFVDPLSEPHNLPLIVINTNGQTIVDEPKITAWLKVIDNGEGQTNTIFDEPTDYDSYIGIEIRGQSSQMFPKKSFSMETRDVLGEGINVSLLGLPEEEDWVLYAPYSDKTMMRNALTYHLGRTMGTWQPRYKFCEVYLNGSYHGVYMLIEKIKRDVNRVDVNKLKEDEISGDDLTGGYILKVDKLDGTIADEYFYTNPSISYHDARNYAFTYVYPKFDDIVNEQKTYIYDYLTELENTLNGASFSDPEYGFRKYMDVNSFVDFQIINELTNNVDGYRFSTFFYKKKESNGGKLFAGPLWDFNLGYGNVDYSPSNLATDKWLYPNYGPNDWYPMHWWARLMEDAEYRNVLVNRWKTLRASSFSTDSILANLRDTVQYLGSAIDRNYDRWPIMGEYVWPNSYVGRVYQEELDFLESWIIARLTWMDSNMDFISGIAENSKMRIKVSIYPNPVRSIMNVHLLLTDRKAIELEIVDLLGRQVYSFDYLPQSEGVQSIEMNISKLAFGQYFLKVKQNEQVVGLQKIVISN